MAPGLGTDSAGSNNGICLVGIPGLSTGALVTAAAALLIVVVSSLSLSYDSFWHFSKKKKKKVRVYMDGCFDMMHYGHANALRQARALGDELVVGVVSDEEILLNKGPPVMNMDERLTLVESVKWVDEIIRETPYCINEEFLHKLFDEHQIDYIIHGDDPCILPDGTDAYEFAKKAGRYKQIKRTEGISSTDIVGRMLLCVNSRQQGDDKQQASLQRQFSSGSGNAGFGSIRLSQFLPTSRRIVQFSNGEGPAPNARIVYMDGAFDLFHPGHVEALKTAKSYGDFLLVGLHDDATISAHRGPHHPIMSLHERSLSVLSCRHVDEVILGAPWILTRDLMTTFNISLVVHGSVAEENRLKNGEDPYEVPREMGKFKLFESPIKMTTSNIMKRIVTNHEAFTKRNLKKSANELKYYEEKTYVQDS